MPITKLNPYEDPFVPPPNYRRGKGQPVKDSEFRNVPPSFVTRPGNWTGTGSLEEQLLSGAPEVSPLLQSLRAHREQLFKGTLPSGAYLQNIQNLFGDVGQKGSRLFQDIGDRVPLSTIQQVLNPYGVSWYGPGQDIVYDIFAPDNPQIPLEQQRQSQREQQAIAGAGQRMGPLFGQAQAQTQQLGSELRNMLSDILSKRRQEAVTSLTTGPEGEAIRRQFNQLGILQSGAYQSDLANRLAEVERKSNVDLAFNTIFPEFQARQGINRQQLESMLGLSGTGLQRTLGLEDVFRQRRHGLEDVYRQRGFDIEDFQRQAELAQQIAEMQRPGILQTLLPALIQGAATVGGAAIGGPLGAGLGSSLGGGTLPLYSKLSLLGR